MLVKVMPRGSGGGSGPIDYLLGKNRDRKGATLLRGNPEQTKRLIDSAGFSRNYTSIVLSFEEKEISPELRERCLNEFEEVLFPGLDVSQYSTLWVEHRDKGRIELNCLIANVELHSGKRLQPYYHKADSARVDAWKTIINAEHNLSDPSDPAKKQLHTVASALPRDKKALAEALTRGLTEQARAGKIISRSDVVEALEAIGLEVVRQTKSSISIKSPDGGQNIRLKGALYEQDFRVGADIGEALERGSREFRCDATRRTTEARERLTRMLSVRARDNQRRYPLSHAENGVFDKRYMVGAMDRDFHNSRGIRGVGEALGGANIGTAGNIIAGSRDRPKEMRSRTAHVRDGGTGRGILGQTRQSVLRSQGVLNDGDRTAANPEFAGSGGREGGFTEDVQRGCKSVQSNWLRIREASSRQYPLGRALEGSGDLFSAVIEHIKTVVNAVKKARAVQRARQSRGYDRGR